MRTVGDVIGRNRGVPEPEAAEFVRTRKAARAALCDAAAANNAPPGRVGSGCRDSFSRIGRDRGRGNAICVEASITSTSMLEGERVHRCFDRAP